MTEKKSQSSVKQVYLVGSESAGFVGRKLPTNKQVLSVFFHHHRSLGLSIKKSAAAIAKEVKECWDQAEIPTSRTQNIIRKFMKLFNQWELLNKSSQRKKSATQKIKECSFRSKMEELFDVSCNDAFSSLTSEEKRTFLSGQKNKNRRGFVSRSEKSPNGTQIQPNSSSSQHVNNDIASDIASSQEFSSTPLSVPSSQFENSIDGWNDQIPSSPKRPKLNIISENVAAALDRANLSSRNAAYIIAAVATELGHNIDDINLSHRAIHDSRIKMRKEMFEKSKNDFVIPNNVTLHWDGKLLIELTGTDKVDRLPIVITYNGQEKLLAVPKLTSGTGRSQALVIIETLNEWNISHHVKALCFDTAAVNSGPFRGTCCLVEKMLGRQLIHLACRHHVYELVLRSVFEIFCPTSTGPSVPIFGRFSQAWNNIDPLYFQSGMEDENVADALAGKQHELLTFIADQLKVLQPRDDYKELLELAYIFLGGTEENVNVKRPGAIHHARWMAKAIYSLKIFIFREQFVLSDQEKKSLREICIFIVLFYIEAWFRAPCAILAPNQDLSLLQNFIRYCEVNSVVGEAATKKLASHLWYLNEKTVALSFFDSAVPISVKAKMVQALQSREKSKNPTERVTVKKNDWEMLLKKDISDFVTQESLFLFQQFNLPHDFLKVNIELWPENASYLSCLDFFKNLKVVNDVAERGVALIEAYNGSLTKNEEQLQYLLGIVQNHRQKYPNCNKQTLKKKNDDL